MTTTFGDLVDRALRAAPQGGKIDRLDADISSGTQYTTVSFVVTDASKWGAPATVEIDQEIFHVTSFTSSTRTATAIRGFLDSTPASHSSATAVIHVSPRFYRRDAADAVVDGLAKMSPPLQKVTGTNLTLSAGLESYNLPSDCRDVYEVWHKVDGTSRHWRELRRFDIAHDLDTSEFAGGKALILRDRFVSGNVARVVYFSPYTAPTTEATDMEATCGVQAYALDLPVWYAVSVLLPPDEVRRGQIEAAASSQRAEQVPPQTNVRTAEYYRSRFERGLEKAAQQFRQQYPPKIRIVA